MEVMETKICAQCGQEKPIEDFSKLNAVMCIECEVREQLIRKTNKVFGVGGVVAPKYFCILDSPRFIPDMRTQIATASMQGLLAGGMKRGVVSRALELADALLNELKKKKDENDM